MLCDIWKWKIDLPSAVGVICSLFVTFPSVKTERNKKKNELTERERVNVQWQFKDVSGLYWPRWSVDLQRSDGLTCPSCLHLPGNGKSLRPKTSSLPLTSSHTCFEVCVNAMKSMIELEWHLPIQHLGQTSHLSHIDSNSLTPTNKYHIPEIKRVIEKACFHLVLRCIFRCIWSKTHCCYTWYYNTL